MYFMLVAFAIYLPLDFIVTKPVHQMTEQIPYLKGFAHNIKGGQNILLTTIGWMSSFRES